MKSQPKSDMSSRKSIHSNIGSKLVSLAEHFSNKVLYIDHLCHPQSLEEAQQAFITYSESKESKNDDKNRACSIYAN